MKNPTIVTCVLICVFAIILSQLVSKGDTGRYAAVVVPYEKTLSYSESTPREDKLYILDTTTGEIHRSY